MTRIPFKISLLDVRHTKVKFIIIHHTACQYTAPGTLVDNPEYQTGKIMSDVLLQKTPDVNYHYVIDKIKEDYVPIVCRPAATMCDFDDIPRNINEPSIHVALTGNYDLRKPESRLYEVLTYRLLNSLLKAYALNPSRILLHGDISTDEEQTCPGDSIEKDKIITMVRRFVIK